MATLLDNISVSGNGQANVDQFKSVHVEITGSANVDIQVSKDDSYYDTISTISASGIYVPNAIAKDVYVKAIATITSGNVTVIV